MSDKKHKIAFVGNSLLTMTIFRIGIIRELAKSYEVVVVAPNDSGIDAMQAVGVRFIPVSIDSKGTNPLTDIRLYRDLKVIYQQEGFDFIFHFTIKPNIYGSRAASSLGIRHINVITGLGYTFIKKNWLFRLSCFLHRVAMRQAESVWFLNEDDKETFVQLELVDKERVHVIHGEGVDSAYYQSDQPFPESFVFLYIGRMLRYKGVDLFAKAAEILQSEFPIVRWQLLGAMDADNPDGISADEMENWVHKGYVEYLGVAKDVRPYISRCSCVVLPSRFREGVPRSLLEAASMERPIITTDSVGCKEVVADRINGLLCEKRSLDSLVEAMRTMLRMSKQQLTAMGIAGRQRILQQFDEQIILEEYNRALERYVN